MACNNGNKNLIKQLIELGIDINKENNKCMISLFNAYENENIKNFMKYLIELGTHINNELNLERI